MELYIGVDVGKFNLDIFMNNKHRQTPNDSAGIKKFIRWIEKEKKKGVTVELIICEATGGYERLLVNLLAENDYPLHVAHPNKVRDFAKSLGKLAKTDRIDAQILSDYGKKLGLKANDKQLSSELVELQGLLERREQLVNERTRETNRLDKPLTSFSRGSIERNIQWLQEEIDFIEKKMKGLVQEHESLKKSIDLLTSIPGIGLLTATTFVSMLPELGQIENKPLSALTGVAPMNKDSGTQRGKRFIKGGRATIRKILYMAAMSAIRCNSVIKIFYHRLRARGKAAKVALVAAMRKLLLIISDVYKRQTPWVENPKKGLT